MGTDALSKVRAVMSESALWILKSSAVSSRLRLEYLRSSFAISCSTELISLFEQFPSQRHHLRQPSRAGNA